MTAIRNLLFVRPFFTNSYKGAHGLLMSNDRLGLKLCVLLRVSKQTLKYSNVILPYILSRLIIHTLLFGMIEKKK